MVVVVEENKSLEQGFPHILFLNHRAREYFGLKTLRELFTPESKAKQAEIVERDIVLRTTVSPSADEESSVANRSSMYHYAHNLMDIFRAKLGNKLHEVYFMCMDKNAAEPDERFFQVQRL